jgi:hypothetical protein
LQKSSTSPFSTVHVDILGPVVFVDSEGLETKQYCLTIIDQAIRRVELVNLETITEKEVFFRPKGT